MQFILLPEENITRRKVESIDCVNKREARFNSKCKMKTSFYSESIVNKIRVECSDKAMKISDHLSVTLSAVSAEVARVQANL